MKISKGHYVPKELITSEAVHEAVVKVFVAAGFKDRRPMYGNFKRMELFAGLCADYQGEISWGDKGSSAKEPLTLQQLFTADNGLQWPLSAYRVLASPTCVWFDLSQLPPVVISGNYSGGADERVLATRQPKEKEVKSIEDAVIAHNGVWLNEKYEFIITTQPNWMGTNKDLEGKFIFVDAKHSPDDGETEYSLRDGAWMIVCHKDQFNAIAKDLGFINGYRWGVEHQVNGKRPELPDDVIVYGRNYGDECGKGDHVKDFFWNDYFKFKITDQRYKPADTSYLNALTQAQSLTHNEEGLTHKRDPQSVSESAESKCDAENVSEWWDYENDKAIKLPPVGAKCEVEFSNPRFGWSGVSVDYIGKDIVVVTALTDGDEVVLDSDEGNFISKFRPLDHATRKAEMEKKKAVEQGAEILCEAYKAMGKDEPYFYQYMEALYAAGWRQTK